MSRIHDALRGGSPVSASKSARGGHTDAVLSALGYRTQRRAAPARPMALVVILVAGIGVAWVLRPAWFARVTWQPPKAAAVAVSNPAPAHSSSVSSRPPSTVAATPPVVMTTSPVAPRAAPDKRPLPLSSHAATAPPATIATGTVKQRTSDLGSPTSVFPAPMSDRRPPASDVRADDLQFGLYYQRAGDFEQALLHYKAALQRDEMNLEAHNNLGYLYLGKNLYEEAAREFQRVVAIEPGYATAHLNLSATLYKLGRFDAAAAEARQVLMLDPKSADALVNLALAQKEAGQHGDAERSLRRALELDFRNAAAHYNFARQYDDAGDPARAIDHYRQFLQYAGPEQQAYAQDVRSRIQTLQARLK